MTKAVTLLDADQFWESLKQKRAVFLYRNFFNEDTGSEDDIIGVIDQFRRDENGNVTGRAHLFDDEILRLSEFPNDVRIGFKSLPGLASLDFLVYPEPQKEEY